MRDVIWLQVLVAPAFLAPAYVRPQLMHPYLQLLALLLAPACYVAILILAAPRRDSDRPFKVIASIRGGVFYGALFGLLSRVPLTVYEMSGNLRLELQMLGNLYYASVRARVGEDPFGFLVHLVSTFAPFVLVPIFILLHFVLIGGATAGIIAIMKDSFVILRRDSSTR